MRKQNKFKVKVGQKDLVGPKIVYVTSSEKKYYIFIQLLSVLLGVSIERGIRCYLLTRQGNGQVWRWIVTLMVVRIFWWTVLVILKVLLVWKLMIMILEIPMVYILMQASSILQAHIFQA